jgi:hypothetical protein
MTTKTIDESPVWKQFETEAKKRRRNPVKLVLDLIKEQVEIWEHEKLDDEISRDAQKAVTRKMTRLSWSSNIVLKQT